MSFGHTGSNVVFEKVCLGRPLLARVIYAEELDITFRDNLGYKAYMEDLLFYLDLLLFNCTMFLFSFRNATERSTVLWWWYVVWQHCW